MRVIAPLQGVVQGRGGLVLGSVIPCVLFYFLQLYLKRNRSDPKPPPPSESAAAVDSGAPSPPPSSGQLVENTGLHRSVSRSLLSPRGTSGPAYVSSRANSIVKSSDSPYYVGMKKAAEDPYDKEGNPDGVIHLGLAENKLSLDLVRDWLAENAREAILGGGGGGCGGELSISGIATYQPFDGLMQLKVAIPSYSARRSLSEHYVKTRAEEERKEKRAAQKAAIERFKKLLDEAMEDIDHNTNYQTFRKKWGNDPRFEALDRRDRELLLNERVLPLKRAAEEKIRAERAASAASFKSMLKEKGDLTFNSRWSREMNFSEFWENLNLKKRKRKRTRIVGVLLLVILYRLFLEINFNDIILRIKDF